MSSKSKRLEDVSALNRRWIVCPSCDEVWQRPSLEEGERARCRNCHSVILHYKVKSAERTIALMLAALVLFVTSVSFPFMRMERSGLSNEISILDSITILWDNDMYGVAVICAAFILIFPVGRILLLLFVGTSIYSRKSTGLGHALSFRAAQFLEPWTMAEIFMIGVIVSLIKVGKLADISLGPAFWAMTCLMIVMTLGSTSVCRDTIWQDIRKPS